MSSIEVDNESIVLCHNSQGTTVRAMLLRMTRYVVTFEVYNPYSILQLSEVLHEFQINISGKTVYSGRAIVSSLVNTGLVLVCEATLDDDSWLDVDILSPSVQVDRLAVDFDRLIQDWHKLEQVLPEMKVAIGDIQTLFSDLRRWLEQIEMALRSNTPEKRAKLEVDTIERLNELIAPLISDQFVKFEAITGGVQDGSESVHRAYCRRQIHPLVMCSPFVHRTFSKPLGYAGDYEMVNMILRDPKEGGSLYAKVLNSWFVAAPPAEAHRNRIIYLTDMLAKETRSRSKEGKRTRFFNLGCGPAREVQNFIMYDDLCDRSEFNLLDFNDETLERTNRTLSEMKMKYHRNMPVKMIKRSVHQILKEGVKGVDASSMPPYDVVYCAGLFDYLSDRICRRLMEIFYDLLEPGGLMVTTNVDASNPCQRVMEYVMEWHLIYRSEEGFRALAPSQAPPENVRVLKDKTGVNLFLEVRKPT